jgi:hypothetical protein
MLTVHSEPGMRRILGALQTREAEPAGGAAGPDWRTALIHGQRKVIAFYREVVATHGMPQAERAAILQRIARVEAELACLRQDPPQVSFEQKPAQQMAA